MKLGSLLCNHQYTVANPALRELALKLTLLYDDIFKGNNSNYNSWHFKLGSMAGVSFLPYNTPPGMTSKEGKLSVLSSFLLWSLCVGSPQRRSAVHRSAVPRRMDGSVRAGPRLEDKERVRGWVQRESTQRMLKQILLGGRASSTFPTGLPQRQGGHRETHIQTIQRC